MNKIVWRPVIGFEDAYEVSNTGLVRSKTRFIYPLQREDRKFRLIGRILRPAFNKDCYLKVCLYYNGEREDRTIHQLVATTFLGLPENGQVVHHINEIRWDNRVENLKWVSVMENNQISFHEGREEIRGHKIGKYSLDGELLKEYEAIAYVSKDGYGSRVVNRVVLGQRKHAYGFIWKRIF